MPTSGSWAPFSQELLSWYRRCRRPLPWRQTKDPYTIWVSEVMLQQTQVATVIPYFGRWMARFPNVDDLAGASEEEVLALWAGLGYYRRCKLLQAGARFVCAAGIPTSVEGWRKVPGVGRYTAGAIASIAQGVPAPVVDGNVERVFARTTGNKSSGKGLLEAAWLWADEVLFKPDPGAWNQALMELGATVCKPVNPECGVCPIREACFAFQSGHQAELPVASKQTATVKEFHTCWIPFCHGKLGVAKIPAGDWWAGMWQFPRLVHSEEFEPSVPLPDLEGAWIEDLGTVRHSVTHHRILLKVRLVRLQAEAPSLRWAAPDELMGLPLPSPQRKALQMAIRHLGLS